VSPLRGEKPQNWPLSKLNTGRFALRTMLPVITRSTGQCVPPQRHILPVSQYGSIYGSELPPKFNHLFVGQLPTFPENFVQICLEVFVLSCEQRNNDNYMSSLAQVIIKLKSAWC